MRTNHLSLYPNPGPVAYAGSELMLQSSSLSQGGDRKELTTGFSAALTDGAQRPVVLRGAPCRARQILCDAGSSLVMAFGYSFACFLRISPRV